MSGSLVFPISYGPSYAGSQRKTTARVMKTDFGDGYGQRVADGLNSLRDEWNVIFDSMTEAEMQTADTFLRQRLGSLAFTWTPPGETVPKRWVCNEWSVTPLDPGAFSMSATFVQVFDL